MRVSIEITNHMRRHTTYASLGRIDTQCYTLTADNNKRPRHSHLSGTPGPKRLRDAKLMPKRYQNDITYCVPGINLIKNN